MNWHKPNGDTQTVTAIEKEWDKKGKFVLSLCKNKNTVVQAGGNLGIFPYYLALYFDNVITFEPIQKNLYSLYKNITGLKNIIVIEEALGDKVGTATIKKELPKNCGAIQLKYTSDTGMRVNTLDSHEIQGVDLLWLDVEGFEVKALKGARDTIAAFKPIIVLENNGLIEEFPADLDGSKEFRVWVEKEFGYRYISRIMRDDIYVPL